MMDYNIINRYLINFKGEKNRLQARGMSKIKDTPYDVKYSDKEQKRAASILEEYLSYIKSEAPDIYATYEKNSVMQMVQKYKELNLSERKKLYSTILKSHKA